MRTPTNILNSFSLCTRTAACMWIMLALCLSGKSRTSFQEPNQTLSLQRKGMTWRQSRLEATDDFHSGCRHISGQCQQELSLFLRISIRHKLWSSRFNERLQSSLSSITIAEFSENNHAMSFNLFKRLRWWAVIGKAPVTRDDWDD